MTHLGGPVTDWNRGWKLSPLCRQRVALAELRCACGHDFERDRARQRRQSRWFIGIVIAIAVCSLVGGGLYGARVVEPADGSLGDYFRWFLIACFSMGTPKHRPTAGRAAVTLEDLATFVLGCIVLSIGAVLVERW